MSDLAYANRVALTATQVVTGSLRLREALSYSIRRTWADDLLTALEMTHLAEMGAL